MGRLSFPSECVFLVDVPFFTISMIYTRYKVHGKKLHVSHRREVFLPIAAALYDVHDLDYVFWVGSVWHGTSARVFLGEICMAQLLAQHFTTVKQRIYGVCDVNLDLCDA